MDFRHHIRETISKSARGIELGASYNPILPKAEGYDVLIVDHTDEAGLRAKYTAQGVDVSRVESVDAIDDGGELALLDESGRGFDYILASHVFEHLTDPIHFLQRCERALMTGGRLILLVPDRRFCFDYLRPVSTAGQMLRAFLAGQKFHDAGALYDHFGGNAARNGAQVWAEVGGGDIRFVGTPAEGYARAVHPVGDYVDCHAWVFTPSSFRLILHDLRALGLITLGETFFHTSIGCEFMVELTRGAPSGGPSRDELAIMAIQEAAVGGVIEAPPAPAIPLRPSAPMDERYVRSAPSAQNAVDLFAGSWVCVLPARLGVQAGAINLIDDVRIQWLIDTVGGVQGLDVLELGPLEASHTAMLVQGGAASVLAVESNREAFLRCLVVKELLGLTSASFMLGDFVPFLEDDKRAWSLILASGVLYHMVDPLRFLELLAQRTDTLFLWTHVVDDHAMPEDDLRRAPITGVEERDWRGRTVRLYVRPYGAVSDPKFCGGPNAAPRWLEREDSVDGSHGARLR